VRVPVQRPRRLHHRPEPAHGRRRVSGDVLARCVRESSAARLPMQPTHGIRERRSNLRHRST
jgi:hypothetical protein